MKNKEKTSMINTANLKSDALNAASTMGGFMVANVASKVIPLQNNIVKSIIPLALGLGVTLVTENAAAKSAAYGAMAHGTLSLVKATLMGDNPIGARTAGNPMVAKIINHVIPEGLGSVERDYSIVFDPYEDVTDAYQEPMLLDGYNEDAFALQGTNRNENAFSLNGAYITDGFDQAPY